MPGRRATFGRGGATDGTTSERPSEAWSLVLPLVGGRFETFQGVEYLIIATAYFSHFFDRPVLGWRHVLIWTVAIGAFTLSEHLEGPALARGWAVPYILARVVLVGWALWLDNVGFITTFLFFIVVAAAWGMSRRLGLLASFASAITIFGTMFLQVGISQPGEYIALLPWLAGLGFIGGTTQLAKREQASRERSEALLRELTAAHQQLQTYADQATQLATTQERNRLAREIHDSLGHYLTIINVQLETAQALRPRDAERADRAVGEAKRLASEALADVRRSVAALRPAVLDTLSLREAIERQVADFREHSGLTVELALDGDAKDRSQAVELALYRAVQEGLTNIRKHAAASSVAIALHFGPATTELTITDDGRGLPPGLPGTARADGGGLGLLGLDERLHLLGGTLDLGPGPHGGTRLHITIPCDSPR